MFDAQNQMNRAVTEGLVVCAVHLRASADEAFRSLTVADVAGTGRPRGAAHSLFEAGVSESLYDPLESNCSVSSFLASSG